MTFVIVFGPIMCGISDDNFTQSANYADDDTSSTKSHPSHHLLHGAMIEVD